MAAVVEEEVHPEVVVALAVDTVVVEDMIEVIHRAEDIVEGIEVGEEEEHTHPIEAYIPEVRCTLLDRKKWRNSACLRFQVGKLANGMFEGKWPLKSGGQLQDQGRGVVSLTRVRKSVSDWLLANSIIRQPA